MNDSLAKSPSAVRQMSPIEFGFAELRSRLNDLHDLAENFESKLSPVMDPDVPSTAARDGQEMPPSQGNFLDRIRELQEILDAACSRFNRIQDRLIV